MTRLAVAIAGQIASGKSTLASELSHALGLELASFTHSLFSPMLDILGLQSTRSNLQRLGALLMDFPGEAKLVDAFLQRVSSDTFLIDDVRYPTTVEIMRRQGIHVYLVFVHVDQPLRHHRAVARDQVTASEQRHADNAKTESRIPELAAMADLEVNNTGDLTHTLQAVLPILRPHIHEE